MLEVRVSGEPMDEFDAGMCQREAAGGSFRSRREAAAVRGTQAVLMKQSKGVARRSATGRQDELVAAGGAGGMEASQRRGAGSSDFAPTKSGP